MTKYINKVLLFYPGVVAQAYNPSYLGGGD
jgi:hypothetical protein